MSLFPLLTAEGIGTPERGGGLPLYREAAWNFQTNTPLWRGGSPVWVTGAKAVAVWAWNTLHTVRGAHDPFTNGLGQAIRELIGRPFTDAIRQEEAVRYVREALMVNPYITNVSQVSVAMEGSRLAVDVTMQTIYGEVTLRADDL